MDNDTFLSKLLIKNKSFEKGDFICCSKYVKSSEKIIVKDKFGYCKIRPNALLKGNSTTLKSAIFKENYLQNKLSEINKSFRTFEYRIIKYENENSILIKSFFGIHITSLSNLYRGSKLSISSATNKTQYAINEFVKKYNGLYSFDNFEFINAKNQFFVTCKKHGNFKISYDELKKRGCPKCSKENGKTSNKGEFLLKYIKKFDKLRYDYSKFKYVNAHFKSCIICPIHGEFFQTPNNHLNGQGCPTCRNIYKPCGIKWWKSLNGENNILYVLECFDEKEQFIKIGITTKTVKERYRKTKLMPYEYKILFEHNFKNRTTPFIAEKEIFKILKLFHYRPKKSFGGSKKECFYFSNVRQKQLFLEMLKCLKKLS